MVECYVSNTFANSHNGFRSQLGYSQPITSMKTRILIFCFLFASAAGATAQTTAWPPSPPHTQIAIWPGAIPDAQPAPGPEDTSIVKDHLVAGKTWLWLDNVTQPTITVYSPTEKNTGVAVVVFPGGGFEGLAIDLEGTEVCDWLTSRGITCVLLKYRVPSLPYDWHCKCRPNHGLNKSTLPLEDAQRTIGLVRLHAAEWHIDPHKVGVLGFSAGGYLVAEISTDFARRLYKPIDAADKESCRPDFAVAVYPGHLSTSDTTYELNPQVPVTPQTSPTFLAASRGRLRRRRRPVARVLHRTTKGQSSHRNASLRKRRPRFRPPPHHAPHHGLAPASRKVASNNRHAPKLIEFDVSSRP